MKDSVSFKTNILLKDLIGRDLINDDNIAVVELVKNSYDARSKSVVVRFENLVGSTTGEISRLCVHDQGAGMATEDIKEKWLNIAYSEKRHTVAQGDKRFAGNKGVGRFSCDRLGSKLDLITRQRGGQLLHLMIPWTEFEVDNIDLEIQSVSLTISTISEAAATTLTGLTKFPAQGTSLIISGLRATWDAERFRVLRTALERFQNPNQAFQRDVFALSLEIPGLHEAPEAPALTGPVRNQVFERLRFKATYIEASIDPSSNLVRTVVSHDGEDVFRLDEHQPDYGKFGHIKVVLYYLNPYKKAYFTRQTGVRSLDFGSVFLFLDGFRVAPYGDRGNDWLRLDVRKTQGVSRYLSSRDIVGRIEVDNAESNLFQPVSSREGLKKTVAFEFLTGTFFMEVLRRLERFVVDGLAWDSVSPVIREELKTSEGLDWRKTSESYQESWERKRERIALSMMALVGADPDKTQSFWFNPGLLEGLAETNAESARKLLRTLDDVRPDTMDRSLGKALGRLRTLVEQRDAAIRELQQETTNLRETVVKQRQQVAKLRTETDTYKAQVLFFQSINAVDKRELLAFHHQINQDSDILGNYLSRANRALRKGGTDPEPVLQLLEKASMANQRISAVAKYASKANFRAGMKKEPTSLPDYIQQYLLHVARDFSASGLRLDVVNSVRETFEVKVSRVELSILIDNLIHNAKKAHSRSLAVKIDMPRRNTLRVAFTDDGRGLSSELSSIDQMFEPGVTTTAGSGLGLYHARQIAEGMGAQLTAAPNAKSGLTFTLEIKR